MKINWLDGKDSAGMFVLEIMFRDGGTGFLKSESGIIFLFKIIDMVWDSTEVVGLTIFDPKGKPLATKTRMVA